MKISKDTAVTLHYSVTEANGKPLASRETTDYLHGGYGNTLPKIEEVLEGQEAGFRATLELQPEDAFGRRDAALERSISKSDFPPGVKVGGHLRGMTEDGREQVFTVVKIKGDQVLLDANHPWADKALKFTLQVGGVRAATAEEIAHGHVHGGHGHHH
ncbi:MAG TPA: FKBP-type peptidyl-prolyl cis-trans isomerase [Pseudorhodoferax sp.]|jgi:FKBP-type peptidyl-prolyl cis-trans isomerase SlyD|nr:FKBP-type peptidyl-prolyl cis-trans isomerase [Pseudorhodoferax sp.]